MKMNYVIRDHQAGNEIERFETLEEAVEEMQKYVNSDKEESIYEEAYYEVYNEDTDETIVVSE